MKKNMGFAKLELHDHKCLCIVTDFTKFLDK